MPNDIPNQEGREGANDCVAWDHVDRLDGLNAALNELAYLMAEDDDSRVPALIDLLRDQFLALRATFVNGLEGPATGGAQ